VSFHKPFRIAIKRVAAQSAATRFWVLIRYKLQIARNVGAFIFALILLM